MLPVSNTIVDQCMLLVMGVRYSALMTEFKTSVTHHLTVDNIIP
jgi:hypothetical protein